MVLDEAQRIKNHASKTAQVVRSIRRERSWALTLLEQVLTRLENEYRSAGNAKLFDCLKEFLSDEPGRRSQAQAAAELGMTENALKQAFHRVRQRYRQLLHDEIAQTVAVPGDVEDELRRPHVAQMLEIHCPSLLR